jgi:CBS domain-containing protein
MQRIQKTISEFVSGRPVPALGPDDDVATAIAIMKSQRSDCVMVIEGDALLGIFTERDFLYRVAARQRLPGDTIMREVMTPEPKTLRPRDSVAYAINCMVMHGFRNIPIVDDQDHPISILDIRTIISHTSEVFAEIEEGQSRPDVDEWTDIGGGD